MLDKLFAKFTSPSAPEPQQDSLELAFAALLIEAAVADEEYTDKEKSLINHMISAQFNVDENKAIAIREDAEAAQQRANDLHQFSRVVKTDMDHDDKLKLIEDMWVIALSDAERAPYEEMIIRRLVGLIHVTDPESAAARNRATERLNSN